MNHFHNWKLVNSPELGIVAYCDCGSQLLDQKEIEIVLNSTLSYGTFDIYKMFQIHDSYWEYLKIN